MFNIILFQPEIPPNTGNIIRLAANMGAKLHLIEPLGFELSDKHLKRAGLDYHSEVLLRQYQNLEAFYTENPTIQNIYCCTTKASMLYTEPRYGVEDAFMFGPETRGLPSELLNAVPQDKKIRIPMIKTSRSLNLSNAVSVILYEAWRQQDFIHG